MPKKLHPRFIGSVAQVRKGGLQGDSVAGVEQLVQRWRHDATLLRQYKVPQAEWLEDRATELETALTQQDAELVTLTEAALISGYSRDHLGRLVRSGALQNLGRSHAPKVRRGDLPRKPLSPGAANTDLLGASRRQVAQAITTSESSRR